MTDYLFRGKLNELDLDIDELIQLEAERQARKLIMIPSESTAPEAVREGLGSVFQNIYAEGYPDEDMRWMNEEELTDYAARLAHYRRYSDPRYYKGVEYADIIESLARRRCAEAFATPRINADQIFVNVQPLSGAPANNAVYTALINPGDSIMGMNLLHGGHLSHGSSVNRSGKLFKVIHYAVDPVTEQIDYEMVEKLAKENQPRIIIAGYSSYPWVPDYERFRKIADGVGAYLLADISHIAGMTAAGVIPSPVGYAHIITFTTHKTLCGPRGACILTTDSSLSKKLDRAVFPGEQGGPHVHAFAGLATTFKLAKTESFRNLQKQIIKNCVILSDQLQKRGLRIPFGGTNTHLTNVDCKTIIGEDGTRLSGDIAARILDLCGIVANRNTIPGDKTALFASGIRLGTPWLTQRGMKEEEMVQVANIIADILLACKPYTVETRQGPATRAKMDFHVLEEAKIKIRVLADIAGRDLRIKKHGYPHFFFLDDPFSDQDGWVAFDMAGKNLVQFLNYVFSSNVEALGAGQSQKTSLFTPDGKIEGVINCVDENKYQLSVKKQNASLVATWLRDLSDGFVSFDIDLVKRLPGPVIIDESKTAPTQKASGEIIDSQKPYYLGLSRENGTPIDAFIWEEKEVVTIKKTPLNEVHKKSGAKMVPFAGWEMPVWYTSVVEEHMTTRQAAGLFDVSHMGVYQAEGRDAVAFLDSVCGNDIGALEIGESCYTHLLDPNAKVLDDCLVYHRAYQKYLVVVNASNDDKDWAWLNAVRAGKVMVDTPQPWVKVYGRDVLLRNLRDPQEGKDMRVDIALQGPKSREILLSLGISEEDKRKIMGLKRTELCEAVVGGMEMVVSRTGYTGEKMAFELFVHPDHTVKLWNEILKNGESLGVKPCGLGARDSLRTEAGLPLYGHEFTEDGQMGVGEGGFGSYVKIYKPWFIGRDAFIEREKSRQKVVTRFSFNEKGVRMAHNGDPVLDNKGRVIGHVTSCAIDSEGFLTGQACIEIKSGVEGTAISIFQSAGKVPGKAPAELIIGEKVVLPSPATVLSRFPK